MSSFIICDIPLNINQSDLVKEHELGGGYATRIAEIRIASIISSRKTGR
jgi:hypothetical protein